MKTTFTKNFISANKRIDKCKSVEKCDSLEKSFERIWENGIFTLSEYLTLDGLLNEKRNEIEEQ
jgi:hypothetical protein